jgi:2-octaprenyl-6-methoxyphenol hydroxylase
MTEDRSHDVIVAGGGLAGGSLALALGRAGFRVALVDAVPAGSRAAPGFDGRAYALALASVRMLGALGLWAGLKAQAQPILGVRALDGKVGQAPSPLMLAFDDGELDEGALGAMVEDRHLRPALMAALDATPGVTQIAGRIVAQAVGAAGICVTLEDGARVGGALLVGADGKRSGTAARAGIRRAGHAYGQTAIVCAVAHERPHGGIAHQLFLPAGPLAILPLQGNRSSIVWSEADAQAAALLRLPDDAFLAALSPRFGGFLGAIALLGPRWSYPLELSLAQAFTAPRLALVGEAAHAIHPIAGQGLNLGLRDVAALAEVLAEARARGEDIGAAPVLERYARWRRFDTAALAAATDLFARLFSNDNPLLRGLRDLGMAAVSSSPGLRRAFARQAAGLSGEVPRLLRGLPAAP